MSFSKRQLFKAIHKQISFKAEDYIQTALDLIDLAIENEEVTDSFYNELKLRTPEKQNILKEYAK